MPRAGRVRVSANRDGLKKVLSPPQKHPGNLEICSQSPLVAREDEPRRIKFESARESFTGGLGREFGGGG
jgi:hypothetical protein